MKVIVIGLGVQGHKRQHFAAGDFVASVDPVNGNANVRDVTEVPLSDYDAALVCVPDGEKLELLSYLVGHGKHVLVEKPLWIQDTARFEALEAAAVANGVVCYTAYNHRFEPHFRRMRDLIASGDLGEIYRCRMFYGNGTAQLVRDARPCCHCVGQHQAEARNGNDIADVAQSFYMRHPGGKWIGAYRVALQMGAE